MSTGSTRAGLYTTTERMKLDRDLLVASRMHGYLQAVGNIGVFTLMLVLASLSQGFWQGLAAFAAVGFAMHRLFFPAHDCMHYSLFPTKGENRFMGAILSALMGTTFDAIRIQHLDHHRLFATPEDPGARDYYVKFRNRREFLTFLFGPLAGTIFIAMIDDYLLRIFRRAKDDDTQEKKASVRGNLFPFAALLLVQFVVAAILTRGFEWAQLWRYVAFNVLPAITIFLFLIRLRMFLEHAALDYIVCDYFEQKRPTARTIYASFPERILLCGSDFNYHHEHHLYPVVPGWQLRRLHKQLVASGLDPQDIRLTYWQAFREIWHNLKARTL